MNWNLGGWFGRFRTRPREVFLGRYRTHDAASDLQPEDILTPEELAKRLKVGVGWIYEKSRVRGNDRGTPMPVLRMGRYLRFAWPDVVAWMRGQGKEKSS